MFVET
jgi:O-phosphoseryl-tRNA(Sec) selenium transferase, SepSecS